MIMMLTIRHRRRFCGLYTARCAVRHRACV